MGNQKTGSMHRMQARSTYLVLASVLIALGNYFEVEWPFDTNLTVELMILLSPIPLGIWAMLERWFGTKKLYFFWKPDDVRS